MYDIIGVTPHSNTVNDPSLCGSNKFYYDIDILAPTAARCDLQQTPVFRFEPRIKLRVIEVSG
jgi:hypothetical protein